MLEERLLEMRFPAKPERLTMVRSVVKKASEAAGFNEKLGEKLVIAVNEACMNVIQHAYGGGGTGDILLEISSDDSHIMFRLVDFADPIDLDKVKSRELDDIRPGGLGVHFINEIMDELNMGHLEDGKGNYIEMKKIIS